VTGRFRVVLWPVVGIVMILATGCSTYTQKLQELRPRLADGQYDRALELIEKETGGKDELLAALEQGLVLHQAGRYEQSNVAFATAERLAEELYATSLSEGAVALITNDMARSYRARPFEMVMVPYYRALNYLSLGDRDAALVEARKTSLLLRDYIDATIEGIERGDTDDLERTRNDPFMLYFSGMLYDWDGELNDAFIAYRNAATAYQDAAGLLGLEIPPWLGRDLERVSRRIGFGEELDQVRRVCPDVFAAADALPSPLDGPHGELVLLLENGWVGAKGQTKVNLPIFESDSYADNSDWAWDISGRRYRTWGNNVKIAYWLTVALPTIPEATSPTRRVVLRDAEGRAVRSVRAHHPTAQAQITAEAEAGMVLFRTVLRGLAKYLTYRAADKQGEGLGLLANIFNVATEVADTRSWLTLPDQIQLVRVPLPPGRHDLDLQLEDTSGRSLGVISVPGVDIRTGDWTFLAHRVYGD
jgi:hypothetical protein